MTDTFRALCAELVDAWLKGDDIVGAMNRARAALGEADEPAVPESREPASVTGQPSDGEVAELAAWLQEEADDYECVGCKDSAAKCKRVAELLQRQVPQPPADGEVAELVAKLRRLAPQNPLGTADPTITRAADLLQR